MHRKTLFLESRNLELSGLGRRSSGLRNSISRSTEPTIRRGSTCLAGSSLEGLLDFVRTKSYAWNGPEFTFKRARFASNRPGPRPIGPGSFRCRRMHLNGSGSSLRIPKKRPEELCLQSRHGTIGGKGGDRKKTPRFRSPGGSAKMIFCATPMGPTERRYSGTHTIWPKKWETQSQWSAP